MSNAAAETVEPQDTIDVVNLSDDDLQEKFEASQKEGNDAVVKPEAVEPEAVEPEAVEPEAVEPEAVEPEAVEPEPETAEGVRAEMQGKLDAANQQIEEKQKHIDTQGNELGVLRKGVTPPEDPSTERPEVDFLNKPEESFEALADDRLLKERQRRDEQAEQDRVIGQEVERVVTGLVPDFSGYVEEIVGLAKTDGISDEKIAAFKDNPFKSSDPDVLLGYVERVKLARQLKTRDDEIETLKKAPGEVAQKIAEAANRTTPPLESVATATPRDAEPSISDTQLTEMSDTELNEMIAKKLKG